MNEQLEEAQRVVIEIGVRISSLLPQNQQLVALIADIIRTMIQMYGENGLFALALVSAELQLQVAERKWADHERIQEAEQETHGG